MPQAELKLGAGTAARRSRREYPGRSACVTTGGSRSAEWGFGTLFRCGTEYNSEIGGESGIRPPSPLRGFGGQPSHSQEPCSACQPKLAEGERRLAERVGFEPTVEFPLHTLSKRAPSTTRTSLRLSGINSLQAVAPLRPANCDQTVTKPQPPTLTELAPNHSGGSGAAASPPAILRRLPVLSASPQAAHASNGRASSWLRDQR